MHQWRVATRWGKSTEAVSTVADSAKSFLSTMVSRVASEIICDVDHDTWYVVPKIWQRGTFTERMTEKDNLKWPSSLPGMLGSDIYSAD